MQFQGTETYGRPYRVPFYNLRWSAIFAGLVVGISANLFLLLLGGTAGLAVFSIDETSSNQAVVLASSAWDTLCVVVATFIVGYVAARASGMRRTADGIMHGAVAWSITVLLSVLLAMATAGTSLNGVFGMTANRSTGAAPSLEVDPRQEVTEVLENRLGLSSDQANSIVDQAMALSPLTAPLNNSSKEEDRATAAQNLHAASVAGSWMIAVVLLSLLAAIGGGAAGARGARRAIGIEQRHTTE